MNMQFLPGSSNSTPVLDEDDPARKYYRKRIRKIEQRFGLPISSGPEYSSILKNCSRFGLITHLIFLYRHKKISRKEYMSISSLGNYSIIQELQKRGILGDEYL